MFGLRQRKRHSKSDKYWGDKGRPAEAVSLGPFLTRSEQFFLYPRIKWKNNSLNIM